MDSNSFGFSFHMKCDRMEENNFENGKEIQGNRTHINIININHTAPVVQRI